MTISAGIIPYAYYNGELMFFVGHPGGNKTNYWSLLKGQHEEHENIVDTAIREFKEESTIDLSKYKDKLIDLGEVVQSKVKNVHAFALRLEHISDIDPRKCKSNMADNCPWPEIDKYCWMNYENLIQKTHKTHKVFYDKILEIENYGRA